VEAICDLVDEVAADGRPGARRDLITFVQDRPGHDFRYAIDPSRAEVELGWRPRVGFEDGLRDTVRWYLENGEWCRQMRGRVAARAS
jgi:dTDP-glucose 4,6-dehydratase